MLTYVHTDLQTCRHDIHTYRHTNRPTKIQTYTNTNIYANLHMYKHACTQWRDPRICAKMLLYTENSYYFVATHTHTRTRTHTHTHTHTQSQTHSLTRVHTNTFTLTLTHAQLHDFLSQQQVGRPISGVKYTPRGWTFVHSTFVHSTPATARSHADYGAVGAISVSKSHKPEGVQEPS